MSMSGVSSGASFGLFTFGMFYPRGNSKVSPQYVVNGLVYNASYSKA